jgi:two-component system NarL family sensor kinase
VACYRIVQEALTNVIKHAHAHRCILHLNIDEALELEVIDDGKGLPIEGKNGIGLTSMRERAQELGGTCSIDTLPEGGTRVYARLPLPRLVEEQSIPHQRKEHWHGSHSHSDSR